MSSGIRKESGIFVAGTGDVDAAVWNLFDPSNLVELEPPLESPVKSRAAILSRDIFGQEDACLRVAGVLVNAEGGLRDPDGTLGNMLFLGPTGVGKTELAKKFAGLLYGANWENHFVRVDGGDLQDPGSVNRLKGTEPKWVGYGNPVLIMPEKIKKGAVVLFDEGEKMHPEVFNWLLAVMEEGETTVFLPTNKPSPSGGQGKEVVPTVLDFRNTFIIMTSNEGAAKMQDARRGRSAIGLDASSITNHSQNIDFQKIGDEALREGTFRNHPEFLGRFDEVIVFQDLGPEEYIQIFDKFVMEANQRLSGLTFGVTPEVRDYVLSDVDMGTYGARNLKQAMQRNLLRMIAEYRVAGIFRPGANIIVDLKNERLAFFEMNLNASNIQVEQKQVAPLEDVRELDEIAEDLQIIAIPAVATQSTNF